jgi:hypothetical protein
LKEFFDIDEGQDSTEDEIEAFSPHTKLPVKSPPSTRLPHAKTARKSVGVIACSAAGRQLFQFTNVSAPDHDVGWF